MIGSQTTLERYEESKGPCHPCSSRFRVTFAFQSPENPRQQFDLVLKKDDLNKIH